MGGGIREAVTAAAGFACTCVNASPRFTCITGVVDDVAAVGFSAFFLSCSFLACSTAF